MSKAADIVVRAGISRIKPVRGEFSITPRPVAVRGRRSGFPTDSLANVRPEMRRFRMPRLAYCHPARRERRIGRYLERQGLLERDAENSYLAGDEIFDITKTRAASVV
jgi:hypothetical protein